VHGRGRPGGGAAETVEEIERSGGQGRASSQPNLGNPAEIRRLAEQAGDIDVLVNKCRILGVGGPTAELDVATFDSMFAANVRAHRSILVAAFAAGGWQPAGKGSIINISSMGGPSSAYPAVRPTGPPRLPWSP